MLDLSKLSYDLSVHKNNFLIPIIGALLIGFMWRVRGDHGFGSMWGMFAVGVALTLLIIVFFGNKMTVRYESIPVAVLLLGITNGGWGTLNSQMSGYLTSSFPFNGEEVDRLIEISPFSGLIIMLLLGFGWMPLFSLFIGSLFSDKKYNIKRLIFFIAIYYISMMIYNISVSHILLTVINPDAVEGFKAGLADIGSNSSPIEAFITNLGSAAWAKKVPFGRNYFTSIEVISSALASLTASLAVLLVLKDKTTFKISTAINTVSAFSITIADIFMLFDSDRGFLAGIEAPDFIRFHAWGLWEYFTGFLLGFGIMTVLLKLSRELSDKSTPESAGCSAKLNFLFNGIFTLFFTFGLTVARPLGMRIAEWVVEKNNFSDEDILTVIFAIIIGIILFIPCICVARKNIIINNLTTPVKLPIINFSVYALFSYYIVIAIIYFFTGNSDRAYFISFFRKTFNEGFLTLIMIVTFCLFIALFVCCCKNYKQITLYEEENI